MKKEAHNLFSIIQDPKEMVKSYMKRLKVKKLEIQDVLAL